MGSLAHQLDAFHDGLLARVDQATARQLERMAERLVAAGVGNHAPRPGESVPDFTLPDAEGRSVSLAATLAEGPTVLVFFRGGWCPFCTLALRALAEAWPKLRRFGAQVLAVSPAGARHAKEACACSALPYPVLTDHGNAVARAYRIAFTLEPEERAMYARFGHDLPAINGVPEWELPIPASFVIGRDRRVVHAVVDPHAYHRLEPADAVAAVEHLTRQAAG
jgi:peroxiredoxin